MAENGQADIQVSLTFDVDAIAGWLGSYGGEDSPSDLSRGEWAGKVGVPRLLDVLDKYDLPSTWFSCAHSIETFPEEMSDVHQDGHEVALHGYSHENPIELSREQEEKILVKSIECIKDLTGKHPIGYRAPWAELSVNTAELLEKHGVLYDSTYAGRDYESYFIRRDDNWYKIDYDDDPDTWMKPYEWGEETDLLELPFSWYRDDLPPMMFIKVPEYGDGWKDPEVIYKIFKAQFDYLYKRKGEGFVVFCMHPDVAARSQCILLLLEPLIDHINSHDNVEFTTCEDIALREFEKMGRDIPEKVAEHR